MLIVLPNERNGLPALLGSLTSNADHFGSLFDANNYYQTEVDLGLPAFSIHGDMVDLKAMLTAMGLGSIFQKGAADFSGITGDKRLYVSKVLHKARIDVSPALLLSS